MKTIYAYRSNVTKTSVFFFAYFNKFLKTKKSSILEVVPAPFQKLVTAETKIYPDNKNNSFLKVFGKSFRSPFHVQIVTGFSLP